MSFFITDRGAEVLVTNHCPSFDRSLQETGHPYIRRIVRNWTIFVSRKTIVVYDAHSWFDSFFSKDDPIPQLRGRIDSLPISVRRIVRSFVENLWHLTLERLIVRDDSGMSDRTFGIELEFCFPDRWTRESLCEQMRRLGINIVCRSYTHEICDSWKMTTDSSVHSDLSHYNTCEINSPILKGRDGLLEVNKVCQVLDDCGCIVNRTCGFHVHHGARDLSERQRLQVIDFYRKNEAIFDTLVSRSRRGNSNSYCSSLVNTSADRFPSDRYLKVNACAYSKYGTLEFRQHQGTINYQKIANWVKLTQRIMEVSSDKVIRYSSLEQMIHALDLDICLDFFNSRVRELS